MHIILDIASLLLLFGAIFANYVYQKEVQKTYNELIGDARRDMFKSVSEIHLNLKIIRDDTNRRLQVLEEAHNKKVRVKKPA